MKQKSKNIGLYLPEWPDLERVAAVESGRAGKPVATGSLIREILQKHLKAWAKKNPSISLEVSRVS